MKNIIKITVTQYTHHTDINELQADTPVSEESWDTGRRRLATKEDQQKLDTERYQEEPYINRYIIII